jgi:hypothetical protein
MLSPKLRTVEKYESLYPLNEFPADFAMKLGREIIYLLAVKHTPSVQGEEWEEMFANIIGATWKPSNVGLDDVVHGQTAWGAKSIKNPHPSTVKDVRLICGRNSTDFSFGVDQIRGQQPSKIGEMVLSIWNERVASVRARFKNVRTVILIKSNNLLELSVFEHETVMFNHAEFTWGWNKKSNLEGHDDKGIHRFTWQPHGSQFTIIEKVPEKRLSIRVKKPKPLSKSDVIEKLGFDSSWVEVINP